MLLILGKKRDPRRHTLPEVCTPSTICATAFHFQVRDGTGWDHCALATDLYFTMLMRHFIITSMLRRAYSVAFLLFLSYVPCCGVSPPGAALRGTCNGYGANPGP